MTYSSAKGASQFRNEFVEIPARLKLIFRHFVAKKPARRRFLPGRKPGKFTDPFFRMVPQKKIKGN
jgi:hypothetical protein